MLADNATAMTVVAPVEGGIENSSSFEQNVKSFLKGGFKTLSIDCSKLNQVTSSHVSMLWEAHRLCSEAKVEMYLLSPPRNLIKILKLLDLDSMFSYKVEGDPHLYADEFTSDALSINLAMKKFSEFMKRLRIPDTTQFELKTVFYEVATNIRSHSGLKEGDMIQFYARPDDNRLTLVFVDCGAPFDPTMLDRPYDPEKAAREGQKRGFGIAMITKLADRLSYERRPEGKNALTLEKKWS